MKKIFTLLLAATMCSTLIVGCTAKKTVAPKDEQSSIVTPPGTYPIVKDKQTLKIMLSQNQYVQDYNTNEFTKYYEDKTNVHVEWSVLGGDNTQKTQKINMLLSSGSDLPDMIIYGLDKAQVAIYGSQGVLVALDDLIPKYAPNLTAAFAEDAIFRNGSIDNNGKRFYLPQIGYTYHTTLPRKMWVYQPWLDKLSLKMPTTTDEFTQMLIAFKTKDPNGNGKADEIPLASQGLKGNIGLIDFLMNAFTYSDDGSQNYLVENNKVIYSPAKPEYKEGIKYIKSLYDQGLIAKDAITMDRKQITALGENPDVPILGAAPALWYGMITTNAAPSGRYKDYVAVPPLKGPKGVQIAPYSPPSVGVSAVITKSCKYPEVAVRWMDYFYSMEGNLDSSWGPKGKGWGDAAPGDKGVDGQPAIYTILGNQTFGQNQNVHWANTINTYGSAKKQNGVATVNQEDTEPRLYRETINKYAQYKKEELPPYLYYSEQDSTD